MRRIVGDERCSRMRQALSLLLDGEAAASDLLVVTSHMSRCGLCREFAARVVAITADLRSVRNRSSTTKQTIHHSRGARA
jgi:predicted anti-sigma-YlaC factor YlaD